MADTIQVVLWALGQKCPLRQGDGWENPLTAIRTLAYCRAYSRLRNREGRSAYGVFGDVCITSVMSARPGDKTSPYRYPYDGFVLSSQFSSVGGLPSLHRLCSDCPANGDPGVAGCVGSFHQALYSPELQEQLDRLIDRLGLASKLDSIFPQTRLHWFRFWIRSPIPEGGAALLHQLLEAVYEEDAQAYQVSGGSDRGQQPDLNAFVKGLERSMTLNIPMHINLAPPGHTDFGWYTTFPHCPSCKAEAPVQRWKRKYRDEEIVCDMCSANFSPARTYSAEHDDREAKDLRDVLGQAEFEKLAATHLMAQGASEAEAGQIVQECEEHERVRRAKLARGRELSRRHELFVEKVIYDGLKNLSHGDGHDPEWLFSPEDTEEIFRRCEAQGGKVLYVSHVSESGEHDDFLRVSWPASAKDVLQHFHDQCRVEKFSVTIKIPEAIVECWHQKARD